MSIIPLAARATRNPRQITAALYLVKAALHQQFENRACLVVAMLQQQLAAGLQMLRGLLDYLPDVIQPVQACNQRIQGLKSQR